MFYPMMVDIEDKNIVIVGAGKVAFRKAKKFLEFGAIVSVVGKHIIEEFYDLKTQYDKKIDIIEDVCREKYLSHAFMVVAATSSFNVNKDINKFCVENNILCNVVDNIEDSSFIVPSTVQRGDLTLAISTLGNSPFLCSKIKKELEDKYGREYEEYVDILGKIRDIVLENYKDEKDRKDVLRYIVDLNLDELKEFYIKIRLKFYR
ncbi:bifunctional precorrin-2 dehydrogenase/sirohydrochlorin ferrochelatase [Haloimpatiens sp. FM7315]|uniref:precorrin-2 dehydrogenase/sirohydrochlorin ferrochelatase family protein n=1 Tax=Haloimpatiens sp. FM7315 TaxID=3298609 RepID=UPI0035A3BAE2